MQTTKFLFVIGTVAVLAAPLVVTAGPDNEAQAKMREALRQKMAELNAQSAPAPAPAPVVPPPVVEPAEPPPPTPIPTPIPTPTPAPTPEPAVKTPTVVVPVPAETPEPAAAPVADGADAERAREALRKKMEDLNAQTSPAVAPVPPPPRPVVPAEPVVSQPPVAPVAAPKSNGKFSEVTDSSEEAKADRLREALHQKMATAPQPVPAPARTTTAPAKPASPAKPVTTVAAPVFSTPAAPALASPFSGSKQERLAELLRRYRADAITPQEYHTQRAKIIAEP